jgi:hypothetical protein
LLACLLVCLFICLFVCLLVCLFVCCASAHTCSLVRLFACLLALAWEGLGRKVWKGLRRFGRDQDCLGVFEKVI